MPLLTRTPAWREQAAGTNAGADIPAAGIPPGKFPPVKISPAEHSPMDISPAREQEPPARTPAGTHASRAGRAALLPVCANPRCRASWLRLWRSRSAPVFEGGWSCSPECTRERLEAALARELDGRIEAPQAPEMHRHRIPLGLEMLEQGWITADQLRRALAAQRQTGAGRIGDWLRREGVEPSLITRALAVQWSCPVFSVEAHLPGSLAALVPRLFLDAYGALPLRLAAGRILYLGFEDRLDPALALAVARLSGLRVECGLVEEKGFRRAHLRALEARYPAVELVEASGEAALALAMAKTIERMRPVEARLVRVRDCVWLRMWLGRLREAGHGPVPALDRVADLIGSLRERRKPQL